MKRISFWLVSLALCAAPLGRAQDAATEQRLNELRGQIDNLHEVIEAQRKKITELSQQMNELREKQNKPTPNYAVQEDLRRVADAVEKVDRNRIEDNKKIHAELERLLKIASNPPPVAAPPKPARPITLPPPDTEKPGKSEKVSEPAQDYFEYEVKKGDTLDGIVQAYREQLKIKLTRAQVLKANPGLTPEKIYVGRKIRIPVPASR